MPKELDIICQLLGVWMRPGIVAFHVYQFSEKSRNKLDVMVRVGCHLCEPFKA
jgi:hypothetical protein